MTPETVRLVIVDDHPIVRAGLRQVLEAAGMTVVADGASGPDALRLLADCRPDVLKRLKSLGDPQGHFTPESIWTPCKGREFVQKKAPRGGSPCWPGASSAELILLPSSLESDWEV